MITRWEVVCVLLVAAGIAVGWLLGHYRAYAECCDCCTCQTCTEPDGPDLDEWDDTADPEFRLTEGRCFGCGSSRHLWASCPDNPSTRRTVVLEPGPTIYPALAELAGEVMDGPHSDSEPTTSTWLMERRLWMENRYPIPVEA